MSRTGFNVLIVLLLSVVFIIPQIDLVSATLSYTISGPYLEGPFTELNGNVTVTTHYTSGYSEEDTISTIPANSLNKIPGPLTVEYFEFDYIYNSTALHREYWLTASEQTASTAINVQFAPDETNIAINIRALGGIPVSGFISAIPVGGIPFIVDQRLIDDTDSAILELRANQMYTLTLSDVDGSSYTFNNINAYMTPIILTVSTLSFPNDVLMQYKYLRIWASRPSDTEIMISYEDTNLNTTSVVYEISFANGTSVYNATHTGNSSFVDTWTGADADTTYYLEANITQGTFGVSTFSQVLLRNGESTSPIDLSFLGDWPVDPTQVFWALVIFIIFGCFSVINSYIGGFAGVSSAVILSWLGWIEIPAGALVAAMCVAIMAGIVYWKRRG